MHKIRREEKFAGTIITLAVNTYRDESGREWRREVVEHPGAAAVVPLVAPGEILMVEQYRPGANRKLLEIPAGLLESGEDPRECAARELEEETGHRAGKLELLFSMYPSAGLFSEQIHIFLATDLSPSGTRQPDEDEKLTVSRHSLADLRTQLRVGNLKDAKTIAALGFLYAFRPGLCKTGGAE
jgi:ADP-ribose pyrophosphatase